MTRKMYLYILTALIIFSMSFLLVYSCESVNRKRVLLSSPYNNVYENTNVATDDFKEDNTNFQLKFGNKIWEFNAKDFCAESDQFDINYNLNKYKLNNNKYQKINLINNLLKLKINKKIIINSVFPKIDKKILNIQKSIEKKPKNAYFSYNGKLNINNEINGINIDFDLFYEKLINNYLINDNVKINIPIKITKPDVCYNDLKNSSNEMARFSTSFTKSTLDRKHNIKVALSKINGTKIEPNQQFSFNQTVGKRTRENGFRTAKIISAGEFVDGVGGGVCQVSTTLYNSALLAGLKINKANKHSEKIGYVKTGFDAMVNWGSSDLIFTNNTNNDIYIFTDFTCNSMTIKIFGEGRKGYTYKLNNEIINKVSAGECEIKVDTEKKYADKVKYDDESFYLKHAKDGFTVKSYREVYFDGKLLRTELLRTDKYNPQNAIKIVGAEKRPTEELDLTEKVA